MEKVLDSLIRVLSTAIDARTPYNANHTRNIVHQASRFIDWMNETGQGIPFTPEKKRIFLMAAWLHDIGKLVTPIEIMDKSDRLGTERIILQNRFERIKLLNYINYLHKDITWDEYEKKDRALSDAIRLVMSINEKKALTEEDRERIEQLRKSTYREENGQEKPWINDRQYELLMINKGTLTKSEREVMQAHVVYTQKLLSQVEFEGDYINVEKWASMHHEKLDGSGYPKGLKGDEIPPEVRILTILDIFDALTASDRPYKDADNIDTACSILREMASAGQLDKGLVELFIESKVYNDREDT